MSVIVSMSVIEIGSASKLTDAAVSMIELDMMILNAIRIVNAEHSKTIGIAITLMIIIVHTQRIICTHHAHLPAPILTHTPRMHLASLQQRPLRTVMHMLMLMRVGLHLHLDMHRHMVIRLTKWMSDTHRSHALLLLLLLLLRLANINILPSALILTLALPIPIIAILILINPLTQAAIPHSLHEVMDEEGSNGVKRRTHAHDHHEESL